MVMSRFPVPFHAPIKASRTSGLAGTTSSCIARCAAPLVNAPFSYSVWHRPRLLLPLRDGLALKDAHLPYLRQRLDVSFHHESHARAQRVRAHRVVPLAR